MAIIVLQRKMKNKTIAPAPKKKTIEPAPSRGGTAPVAQNEKSNDAKIVFIFLAIGAVAIIGLAFLFLRVASLSQTTAGGVKTNCAAADCFVNAANNCEDAKIVSQEDVGTIEYKSTKKCVFTKTILEPNEKVGTGLKAFLKGKSLTCNYKKGKFDRRLVDTLVFGIENCRGNLKPVIAEALLSTI